MLNTVIVITTTTDDVFARFLCDAWEVTHLGQSMHVEFEVDIHTVQLFTY